MNVSRLYILCGQPFAGKTTLAKHLVKRFGFAHIEMDRINDMFGVGLHGEAISPEQWDRTYAEAHHQLAESLKAGQTTLFDAANFTRAQRDILRAIADKLGVSSWIIYIAVSEAEARQRWLDNRATGERYDVRDEDFAQVATLFEPPTPGERAIYYHPTQNLDDWIRQHFVEE